MTGVIPSNRETHNPQKRTTLTVKLDPAAQQRLLQLADLERRIAAGGDAPQQTEEDKELAKLTERRKRAQRSVASAKLAVTDMEAEILRIQEDERRLRARERDDKRQLTAETDKEKRRDLEHDRYAAKSRIADLMSELMECHNEVHALRGNYDRQVQDLEELDKKVAEAEVAAGAAPVPEDPAARADELRADLDAEVLAAYDSRRAENNVGVARFNGRSCSGCYMVLPAADRSRIAAAPADELPECPNCGTYLVRGVA